jgi:2-methylisocitrate lyase-like PEP mutase family enzyme
MDMHADGFFLLPNPWDVGSARMLERMGFAALATTSAGFAATLGRDDYEITFDELCAHVEVMAAAVSVPLNVDAERLFAATTDEVTSHIDMLRSLGAAGVSIEDYDPATDRIDDLTVAVERVAAAAGRGVVLTARAENHLNGVDDLDDTIERLVAYRAAGADAVYAPGLTDEADIARVVAEVGAPVNVLLMPTGPGPGRLAELGVRRASTGSTLARLAYAAAEQHARSLLT